MYYTLLEITIYHTKNTQHVRSLTSSLSFSYLVKPEPGPRAASVVPAVYGQGRATAGHHDQHHAPAAAATARTLPGTDTGEPGLA